MNKIESSGALNDEITVEQRKEQISSWLHLGETEGRSKSILESPERNSNSGERPIPYDISKVTKVEVESTNKSGAEAIGLWTGESRMSFKMISVLAQGIFEGIAAAQFSPREGKWELPVPFYDEEGEILGKNVLKGDMRSMVLLIRKTASALDLRDGVLREVLNSVSKDRKRNGGSTPDFYSQLEDEMSDKGDGILAESV